MLKNTRYQELITDLEGSTRSQPNIGTTLTINSPLIGRTGIDLSIPSRISF